MQQSNVRLQSQSNALSCYWRFCSKALHWVRGNKNYLQCEVCAYLMDLFVESHRQPESGWRWTAEPMLIFENEAICAGDDVASAAQCNYNPYLMGRCGAFRMSNGDSDSSTRTILDKLINFWCQRFRNKLSLMASQKAFSGFSLNPLIAALFKVIQHPILFTFQFRIFIQLVSPIIPARLCIPLWMEEKKVLRHENVRRKTFFVRLLSPNDQHV